MLLGPLTIDASPYRLSGVVYGALLNQHSALAALGDAVHQKPYQAPPKAPILYIKPRNTLAADRDVVRLPHGVSELQIGASLGVVMARSACRLTPDNALDHVAGYLIINDISVPHTAYYRPSVRLKCHDGFCPLGAFAPRNAVVDPDALTIRVSVDGQVRQTASTAELVRSVTQLLVDVTEFMTLAAGDVLGMGAAAPEPLARAGQTVRIDIESLGSLQNQLVAGAA